MPLTKKPKQTEEEIKKKNCQREHERLLEMNSRFETLRQLLQLPEKTKKLSILIETKKYIRQLEAMLENGNISEKPTEDGDDSQPMLHMEERNSTLATATASDLTIPSNHPHDSECQDTISSTIPKPELEIDSELPAILCKAPTNSQFQEISQIEQQNAISIANSDFNEIDQFFPWNAELESEIDEPCWDNVVWCHQLPYDLDLEGMENITVEDILGYGDTH